MHARLACYVRGRTRAHLHEVELRLVLHRTAVRGPKLQRLPRVRIRARVRLCACVLRSSRVTAVRSDALSSGLTHASLESLAQPAL